MIVASYVLHYGAEYLAWSIRSVQDAVDEIQVFYSSRPSFGYTTGLQCPESEEQLKREAARFLLPGKRLLWLSGDWGGEGVHRDTAIAAAKSRGADLVLVVDADEIWDREELVRQLAAAGRATERGTLAPFVHFWRSFGHVCSDPSRPVRIIKPASPEGPVRYAEQDVPVLHFGYAQSEAITKYKIAIHGHRGEWRADWLADKFLSWSPGALTKDVHPTCGWNSSFGDFFWNVRKTEERLVKAIEKTLHDHPYKTLEIIR